MNTVQTYHVWKTLMNGQKVEAEVETPTQWNLSGKFAMWAKCFGCSIDESTAMYFADDRRSLSMFVYGGLSNAKRLAESGFAKIQGEKIPTLTYFSTPFKFNFSGPDGYGQKHAHIEVPMNIKQTKGYITLQINGWPPQVYLCDFGDMGTIGYARMANQWAIGGRMTNITMDWANDPTDYGVINVVGTIDKGNGRLHLFV